MESTAGTSLSIPLKLVNCIKIHFIIVECKNNIEHQCEELYKKLEEMNTNNIQIADENRCLKDKNGK